MTWAALFGHQAFGHQAGLARGSNRSRRPSPRKLIEMMTRKIIEPGGNQSHGIDSSAESDWASESMLPQDGVGGWTPMPRNDSDASTRIAFATPNVAATRTTPAVFGSRWRNIRRASEAPS